MAESGLAQRDARSNFLHSAASEPSCIIADRQKGKVLKLRAFVFDDSEELRSLISSILETRGYEVLSFSEPTHSPIYLACECQCSRDNPCGDIFITDINMPNMTGLEFIENQLRNGCKAILQNKAVMSGGWTEAELEQAGKLGCQIFNKPFRLEELIRWLDECEKRIAPARVLSDLPECP